MKKILVAHDGSESSNRALDEAVVIARRFGARVTVASVIPNVCFLGVPVDCATVREISRARTESILKGAADYLYGMHVEGETIILEGNPAEAIVSYAKANGVDMIVVGSSGKHGIVRMLFGSFACRIASTASCSVLVTM